MKFPGQRKSKHFFPVNSGGRFQSEHHAPSHTGTHIAGIDQNLVDITAQVDEGLLEQFNLGKGASQLLDDDKAEALYQHLKQYQLLDDEFAGGTIGNTLHNYSILADDDSIQFGVMSRNIHIGDYAYRYLCNTSSKVDLTWLQPVPGPIGRCFTLITPDGERTFGISPGLMNELSPEFIPDQVVANSAALALCAYTLADSSKPIYHATMKAAQIAKEHTVPVVLTLGTHFLVEAIRDELLEFIRDYVTVVAMNEEEAKALTGHDDPLLASEAALEIADMVLLTAGPDGLYLSGYTNRGDARQTKHEVRSATISEFNLYEFSRPMLKAACVDPIKVYSQIDPYLGGPTKIKNTNGAGDGALSALLHDMAANQYHRTAVPRSSKHGRNALTYSSFSQVCKYANRVSYQVLAQHAPRLSRSLPEREDSLEEAYWER